jgi:hypothetical protein
MPEFTFSSYFCLNSNSIDTDIKEATIRESLNLKDSGSKRTDFVKS